MFVVLVKNMFVVSESLVIVCRLLFVFIRHLLFIILFAVVAYLSYL